MRIPSPPSAARPTAASLAAAPLAGTLLAACSAAPFGTSAIEPGGDAHPDVAAVAGTLVVDLDDGTSLQDARDLTGLPLAWASERSADESLAVAEVDDLARWTERLGDVDGIEAVEPSLEYQATGLLPSLRYPDDPLYDRQWNLDTIGAPAGWRVGAGTGVTVAVVDTGVSKVADLGDTEVLPGVSFVPLRRSADDDNGHGTHVAGTIAQSTNNGIGVAGVAPRARILPLKALSGAGFGQSQWIASAIDEAVDQGAQVINLSLGGPQSKVIQVAVEKAAAQGVIVVAAAGNTGREGVGWPARSPGAIGVSATGPDDGLAPYSTWGAGVDIAAPGGDKTRSGGGILQDTIDSGKSGHAYKEFQGTSMATPHVAGAAAVLLSAGAGSPAEVRDALYASATDLGEPGMDTRFGHGRLDVAAAVRHLLLHQRGPLFAAGALVGLSLATIGAMRRKKAVGLVAAATAGGLFFLPLLPLPPSAWLDLLARPLLLWPGAAFSPALTANPLWLSALLPAVLTFVLGPTRTLGWLAAGVTAGIGTHLAFGAVTGALSPAFLPGLTGQAWLIGNALLCAAFVVAIAGVEKLRREQRA